MELAGSSVGFIGLGAMGLPMAGHLAAKLPEGTRIYVFDVVQSLINEACNLHPKKVTSCSSAREVSERTV